MKVTRVDEAPEQPNPKGLNIKKLYDGAGAQVMHMSLQPGEVVPAHATPIDVFFFVLEGSGFVTVGEEKASVSAGTLVESPKDIPHGLGNDSAGLLRVMVVKLNGT